MGWRTGADCWVQECGGSGDKWVRCRRRWHIDLLLQMDRIAVFFLGEKGGKEKLSSRHSIIFFIALEIETFLEITF